MLEPFALIEITEIRKKTTSVIAKDVKVGDIIRVNVEFVVGGGKPKTSVLKYVGSGDLYNIANFQYINSTEGGNFYKVFTDDPSTNAAVLFKSIYSKGFAREQLKAVIKSLVSECFGYRPMFINLGRKIAYAIQSKTEPREDSEHFYKDLEKVIAELCQLTKNDCEDFESSLDSYDWDRISAHRSEAEAILVLEVFKVVEDACLKFGYSKEELGL